MVCRWMAVAAILSVSARVVADAADPAPSASPEKTVVHLKYQPTVPLSASSHLSPDGREVVFKREPDFKRHRVLRAVLPVANLGFAVDTTAGKLYVDLNGNFDLTDDPRGTYTGTSDKPNHAWIFSGVTVGVPSAQGARKYNLTLKSSTFNQSYFIYVMSGWGGSVRLHGRTFTLDVMDVNMDGQLGTNDLVRIRSGTAPINITDTFPPMQTLYWDGRGYTVSWSFEPGPGSEPCGIRAAFADWNPTTGTLRLEGKSIRRLTLSTSTGQVVLNSPGSEAIVPAGEYTRATCFLVDSNTTDTATSTSYSAVSVPAGTSIPYRVGGPLKSVVAAERYSGTLGLGYSLTGIGGEIYLVGAGQSEPPPRFEVYKGNKLIASGSFEYG